LNYWLLTTEYPPFHGGGISTYCHFTARMLAEAGHSVTVFVQDDAVADYFVSEAEQRILLLRFNSNRNKLHGSLGHAARLSYAFADMVRTFIGKDGPPDVIEAQDYLGIAYYLTQYKHLGYPFLKDIPIVITLHSPAFVYLDYNRVPTYRFPDFWTGEMEKQAIKAADVLISPTRFLVEEIGRYMDISDRPAFVLANPYQEAEVKAHEGGRPFSRNKIVYYGKLSPQKGSFELLNYFKELWDGGFPHALHVVGGTDIVYHPEMQTMGQLVEKRYASYIAKGLLRLRGKIRPEQIKEYLDDAHVILVPSIVDNLPYVVMEAMSLGKVVLASKQGGQREMIKDGVSGYLFDHTEPGDFGRQLLKVLALTDEEMQSISISACQSVRENYSFGTIGPQKIKLLEDSKKIARSEQSFPFLYQEEEIQPGPDQATGQDSWLSVVIPYYNMGAFIEECVRSILDCTYKNVDILIVNDGSTDAGSIQKLETVGGWDKVQVVHRKNQGLALTRNEGARLARGAFLAFLDADDKVDPSYYEKAIRALQKNRNVYFAGAWVQYFENSSQLWPTFTPQPPYVLVHNPVNSSGLVYKKAAFLSAGLNDPNAGYGLEDYESVISMLHQGLNGVVLPERLFYYRVRSGSMFRDITREKLLYSNRYITEKHAEYYTKFAVQTVNLLNANGPGYLFDNPTFEVRVSSRAAAESAFLLKLKSFVKGSQRLKKIVLTVKKFKR
jgi:glycosyltransferase involved in cell wall biosynthesis